MVEPSRLAVTTTPTIAPSSAELTWPMSADCACTAGIHRAMQAAAMVFMRVSWSVPARRPVAHKPVAVRHLHLRKRLRVHRRVLADDAVQVQHVGADRVDLVVAER